MDRECSSVKLLAPGHSDRECSSVKLLVPGHTDRGCSSALLKLLQVFLNWCEENSHCLLNCFFNCGKEKKKKRRKKSHQPKRPCASREHSWGASNRDCWRQTEIDQCSAVVIQLTGTAGGNLR
eukprot:1149219-Pelagomonas_calceolata.AAC.2